MQQLIEDMIYVAKLEARIEELARLLPVLPSDLQRDCDKRIQNLQKDKELKLQQIQWSCNDM